MLSHSAAVGQTVAARGLEMVVLLLLEPLEGVPGAAAAAGAPCGGGDVARQHSAIQVLSKQGAAYPAGATVNPNSEAGVDR